MINITVVITSESCTDGKYNESSLLKKISDTVTTFISISFFLLLFIYR